MDLITLSSLETVVRLVNEMTSKTLTHEILKDKNVNHSVASFSFCSNDSFSLSLLQPPYLISQPLPKQTSTPFPCLTCFPEHSSLPNKLYNLLLQFIVYFFLLEQLNKDKKFVCFIHYFIHGVTSVPDSEQLLTAYLSLSIILWSVAYPVYLRQRDLVFLLTLS